MMMMPCSAVLKIHNKNGTILSSTFFHLYRKKCIKGTLVVGTQAIMIFKYSPVVTTMGVGMHASLGVYIHKCHWLWDTKKKEGGSAFPFSQLPQKKIQHQYQLLL